MHPERTPIVVEKISTNRNVDSTISIKKKASAASVVVRNSTVRLDKYFVTN